MVQSYQERLRLAHDVQLEKLEDVREYCRSQVDDYLLSESAKNNYLDAIISINSAHHLLQEALDRRV